MASKANELDRAITQVEFDNLNPLRTFFASIGPEIKGQPISAYGTIICYAYVDKRLANGAQEIFYTDGSRYYRKAINGYIFPWKRLATTETPQEYDLPLAQGIIARQNLRNIYRKNQFGEVFVTLSVQSNNGEDTIDLNRGIAVLPIGFRPAYQKIFSGAAHNKAGAFFPIIISVRTDGSVIFGAGTSVFAVFCEMSFSATT